MVLIEIFDNFQAKMEALVEVSLLKLERLTARQHMLAWEVQSTQMVDLLVN